MNLDEQLEKYLRKWSLASAEKIAKTETSQVFKVTKQDSDAVLKILTEIGVEDEENGAIALHCFNGQGAVRLIEADEGAHLLEYADGEDLSQLVKRGEDKRATEIIADTLEKLHASSGNPLPEKLTELKTRFRELFKNNSASIYKRAHDVADQLLESQSDQVVLHGDIHHENIKFSSNRGWLAIDPKGLRGERTYDAANTLMNPTSMEDFVQSDNRFIQTVETLYRKLTLKKDRLIAFGFAHSCLSATWTLESGGNPEHALAMAKIAEKFL